MDSPRSILILQALLANGVSLLLLFLSVGLTPAPLQMVTPLLLMPLIYLWRWLIPAALPLPCIFFLGIINDVLMGFPLGIMPLTLLLLTALQRRDEKRLKQNFWILQWNFTRHLSLALLLQASALSLYQERLIALPPFLLQSLITLLSFPLLYMLIVTGLQRLGILPHEP